MSVKTYAYTPEGTELSGTPIKTETFTYDADKLTAYNGSSLTYNANGGVSSYDGWDYTWTRGKLSTIRKILSGTSRALIAPVLMPSKTYSYTYNGYGQRIGKSYSYIVGAPGMTDVYKGMPIGYDKKFHYDQSGRLIAEDSVNRYYNEMDETDHIVYLYDESGIIGMEYTATSGATNTYYFQRNLQGDVVAIYNTGGTKVGDYAYDAWGNCTITLDTNGIASRNPIRYRGYYFDSETGFYYLNSRYYSPEWRRFISPDDTNYLDPENVNGLNLYCYCGNDPVTYKHSPFYSGSSVICSSLSEITNREFVQTPFHTSVFNSTLANGSFRSGIFFGKGTVTGLYAGGNARAQISLKNGKFVVGAFAKFSLLSATGQIGVGNDIFSLSLVGVGDVGTVSGMVGILIDPKKNTYYAGIEGKAAVFTARGGVQFEILDTQIEAGASVSALSAGFQFGIGIKDGEFYYQSGFAVLFGYDFYIRIRFA